MPYHQAARCCDTIAPTAIDIDHQSEANVNSQSCGLTSAGRNTRDRCQRNRRATLLAHQCRATRNPGGTLLGGGRERTTHVLTVLLLLYTALLLSVVQPLNALSHNPSHHTAHHLLSAGANSCPNQYDQCVEPSGVLSSCTSTTPNIIDNPSFECGSEGYTETYPFCPNSYGTNSGNGVANSGTGYINMLVTGSDTQYSGSQYQSVAGFSFSVVTVPQQVYQFYFYYSSCGFDGAQLEVSFSDSSNPSQSIGGDYMSIEGSNSAYCTSYQMAQPILLTTVSAVTTVSFAMSYPTTVVYDWTQLLVDDLVMIPYGCVSNGTQCVTITAAPVQTTSAPTTTAASSIGETATTLLTTSNAPTTLMVFETSAPAATTTQAYASVVTETSHNNSSTDQTVSKANKSSNNSVIYMVWSNSRCSGPPSQQDLITNGTECVSISSYGAVINCVTNEPTSRWTISIYPATGCTSTRHPSVVVGSGQQCVSVQDGGISGSVVLDCSAQNVTHAMIGGTDSTMSYQIALGISLATAAMML